MRDQIIEDIRSYIKFLETKGYTLSLSFMKTPFAAFAVELMQYDLHPYAICNYLKQNPGTEGRCIHNKKILKKMKLKTPRYACCYAGVEEFLFPLYYEDSFICYIHASGYRDTLEKTAKNKERVAAKCTDQFHDLYNELSPQPPSMKQAEGFIRPLQYMLLELYRLYLEKVANEGMEAPSRRYYVKALRFIQENYPNPITCATLAQYLKYSESYVRYIFKKEGNTTVQAKINEVRLHNAKRLLRNTGLSVTEIAFSVGFADSNYFSSFFRKQEKRTPSEYRKQASKNGKT